MKTTFLFAAGLVLSLPSQAAIYKCVDANKKVTYADSPCDYAGKPLNVVTSEFGGNDNASYEERNEAKRQQATMRALEKSGDEEGMMAFKRLDREETRLQEEKKAMDRKSYVPTEERQAWTASLKAVRAQKAGLVANPNAPTR